MKKSLTAVLIVIFSLTLFGCTHHAYDQSNNYEEIDLARILSVKDFSLIKVFSFIVLGSNSSTYRSIHLKKIDDVGVPSYSFMFRTNHLVPPGEILLNYEVSIGLTSKPDIQASFEAEAGYSYQPYYLLEDTSEQKIIHLWVVEVETKKIVYGALPECVATSSC